MPFGSMAVTFAASFGCDWIFAAIGETLVVCVEWCVSCDVPLVVVFDPDVVVAVVVDDFVVRDTCEPCDDWLVVVGVVVVVDVGVVVAFVAGACVVDAACVVVTWGAGACPC